MDKEKHTEELLNQEKMVKDAVEEAKKAAEELEEEKEEIADAGNEEVSEEESAADHTESDGLFGRKKKKKDKKDELIAELEDKVKRQMAEFDNFRKRTDKEKSHMYEVGAKEIIEKILPVVDNFERGLAAVTEEQKEDPFVDGIDKVYRQLLTTLTELGVSPIEAIGQEFDPNLHNAVMHIEDDAFGENVVADEFQKGYMYKESVIRHSMVKVAN